MKVKSSARAQNLSNSIFTIKSLPGSGFVKLALEQGMEIVPVYAFGESDLYHHSSLWLDLRKKIQKKFGAAIPLIHGQFGLLPYFPDKGVRLVFGEPVQLWKEKKWEKGMIITQRGMSPKWPPACRLMMPTAGHG